MRIHFILYSCLFQLVIISSACKESPSYTDYIIPERDLVPEGVAVDERTGIVYVGSTYKRKIIQIDPLGSITDFITEEAEGIWSPVGMEVDEARGILWVNTAHANEVMPLINPDTARDWMTAICAFDIRDKKLIKKYTFEGEKACFNDLTVLPDGDVYATETVNSRLYKIDAGTDSLQLFLNLDTFQFANGITYAEPYHVLYISCAQGILKINPDSVGFRLLPTEPDINATDIDGLAFNKNMLIGHQSTKVSLFELNETGDEIVSSSILNAGDEFDSSTTGELSGDAYYFIVNSQIRSAIDPSTKAIKSPELLHPVIIRKLKL